VSPSPQAVIRLQGVSKVFPDVPPGTPPALSSLTADVPSGLVVGLVGPDAAGKTTLMRLLAGLLLPTSGSVEVLGRVPGSEASDEAVHDVGYMPQRFGLYEDLSVIDNLNLHAELRGLEGPAREAMFEKLLTFTALKPFTDRLAGKLSGGMKQKLGLACALLTTPRLLLLDEPGANFDQTFREEFHHILREFTADGTKSVILSTHITSDVDRFADYLLLLKKGRQLLYGDIESVRDAYRMVAGERHALRAFGGRLVYMEETPVGCSALVKHDHAEYDRALKVWEPDTEELMYYLAKGAEHGRGNQI